MRAIKTALVLLLATAGFQYVPAGAADAEAGCYWWRDLWYVENDAGRITKVVAANMYVCADPDRGHDNNVEIDMYNPYIGVRTTVASGRGLVTYTCQGDDYRWFLGPGPTLKIHCS